MAKENNFQMYAVEVYRTQGNDIAIKQNDVVDESVVLLHPAQVPAIIEELKRLIAPVA